MDLTYENLAEAVKFSKGSVDVYPDEAKKPNRGEKLNKMCEVSIYGIKNNKPN